MQPVLLEIQRFKVHGIPANLMWDNGSSAALVTHSFAKAAGLSGVMVSYWLSVVGHDRVLRNTTLYTLYLEDNMGKKHEVLAYGIDQISEEAVSVDLTGIRTVFPGAPKEVFNRPCGQIDILIGSAYKNLQPFGGEGSFTIGRLRLVTSLFGCGYIISGTHPSISVKEQEVTTHARTLANCALVEKGDSLVPVVSCNRAMVSLRIPEFFEAEELGVAPAKSCKRCRVCKDCSYRAVAISREKEAVVRRMEDMMLYDAEAKRVSVSYPWTEDVCKLSDNLNFEPGHSLPKLS